MRMSTFFKQLYLYFILTVTLFSCQSPTQENASIPDATPTNRDSVKTQAKSPPPAPDTLYQIIPGQRIGQITVGETTQQVNLRLGQPDSGDAAMGKALAFWLSNAAGEPRHYLAVYFTRSEGDSPQMLTRQIHVTSPRFSTKNKLHTGSSLKSIRSAFPSVQPIAYYTNDSQKQVYIFDARAEGIAFEIVTADSTCTAITVHEKGEDVTNTYLPLHPDITLLEKNPLK